MAFVVMPPPANAPENITKLLVRWSEGDDSALEEVSPFVYAELRQLASHYLNKERPNHTLQATALVHEAFLKLLGAKNIKWESRAHFIGIAARLMRRVLVDYAREHQSQKRGGGLLKLSLSRGERVPLPQDTDLIALDEALTVFATDYPRQAQVVELLFFGGLSAKEAADALTSTGVKTSERTVKRDWAFARLWLLREISR